MPLAGVGSCAAEDVTLDFEDDKTVRLTVNNYEDETLRLTLSPLLHAVDVDASKVLRGKADRLTIKLVKKNPDNIWYDLTSKK